MVTVGPASPDALGRTVAHLAAELTAVQRRTLQALAGDGRRRRHEWTTTYDRLHAMGLIDRVGRYGGQVTELGRAVLGRLS